MRKVKVLLVKAAFALLMYGSSSASAQLYDAQWAIGTPPSLMDFRNDTLRQVPLDSVMPTFLTIGNICDQYGNLLFWTNGIYIANRSGDTMINGDSLSYPASYDAQMNYDQMIQGSAAREGVIILPKPGDSNQYYLFHYCPDDTDLPSLGGSESLNLYYSIVDMRQDSGRGVVVSKNVPIIQHQLLSFSRLAACKHANGRDWWIVKNAFSSNVYYTFLLTPDGLLGPYMQQIGPNYGQYNEQPAYSTFSSDGSKYASAAGISDIVVMDFDRCTGLFSNPDSFYNNGSDTGMTSYSGAQGLAFSPGGKFLYASTIYNLNQYDLSPGRLADSVRIATINVDSSRSYLDMMQLAPNGKIYISCWDGGAYAMSVINQPDSMGLSCDFVLLGQPTTTESPIDIPYFPNYRLGALQGSPCDTLTGISPQTPKGGLALVYPNPANETVQIEVSNRDLSEPIYFVVYDMLGQEITRQNIPLYQIQINRNDIASGIYTWQIQNSTGQVKANGKMVWE